MGEGWANHFRVRARGTCSSLRLLKLRGIEVNIRPDGPEDALSWATVDTAGGVGRVAGAVLCARAPEAVEQERCRGRRNHGEIRPQGAESRQTRHVAEWMVE